MSDNNNQFKGIPMESHAALFGRSPLFVSTRQLIQWGDHFKMDHPQIDAQHEAIFNHCLEISEAWQTRGSLKALKELAAKLAKLLEIHFKYEEGQLAETGYPELKEHKAEHIELLNELQFIRDRLEQMSEGSHHIAPGFIVHNFVLGLTVGHITNRDLEYCAYARKLSGAPVKPF